MPGGRRPHPEALYYHVAGDALDTARKENDPFRKAEFVSTCMVFCSLCLEAYINQSFHKFDETRKVMEDGDRMPLELKWLMLPLLLGASKTFDKGCQPYQTFRELVKTRNIRLVHFKPSSEADTSEIPLKKTYFSDLVSDVSLADKYFQCVTEMINTLHTLTLGKTDLPDFLAGARYTSRVWRDFKIPISWD